MKILGKELFKDLLEGSLKDIRVYFKSLKQEDDDLLKKNATVIFRQIIQALAICEVSNQRLIAEYVRNTKTSLVPMIENERLRFNALRLFKKIQESIEPNDLDEDENLMRSRFSNEIANFHIVALEKVFIKKLENFGKWSKIYGSTIFADGPWSTLEGYDIAKGGESFLNNENFIRLFEEEFNKNHGEELFEMIIEYIKLQNESIIDGVNYYQSYLYRYTLQDKLNKHFLAARYINPLSTHLLREMRGENAVGSIGYFYYSDSCKIKDFEDFLQRILLEMHPDLWPLMQRIINRGDCDLEDRGGKRTAMVYIYDEGPIISARAANSSSLTFAKFFNLLQEITHALQQDCMYKDSTHPYVGNVDQCIDLTEIFGATGEARGLVSQEFFKMFDKDGFMDHFFTIIRKIGTASFKSHVWLQIRSGKIQNYKQLVVLSKKMFEEYMPNLAKEHPQHGLFSFLTSFPLLLNQDQGTDIYARSYFVAFTSIIFPEIIDFDKIYYKITSRVKYLESYEILDLLKFKDFDTFMTDEFMQKIVVEAKKYILKY